MPSDSSSKKAPDSAMKPSRELSRRGFIAGSAAAAAAVGLTGCAAPGRRNSGPLIIPPGGIPDKIRVGLIGCGGRGTGATINCVESSANIEIVALGDLFKDRVDDTRKKLTENEKTAAAMKVTDETCFSGFDNFKKVLQSDIDLVILATPPHFRPEHLEAAIAADKHVFMEKPVAVDPVGIRSVIATSAIARVKGLAIVAGTQRRHQAHYVEIMRRIHDGDIGEIVAAQCYWNMGGLWKKPAAENWKKYQAGEWSDMEWQCRNWLFLCWLSGDHIVEQHIHNLDVVNWAVGSLPEKIMGMGGRQVRTGPEYGNIFDHFSVEYQYADGVRVMSTCRQTDGTSGRVSERIVGTKGVAYLNSRTGKIEGKRPYAPEGESPNPYVQEHADLIASIRAGRPLNEGKRVAESTLTAIAGRVSAYTGREFKWDWISDSSQLDLRPPSYEFGDLAVSPVAVPGETKLV